MGLQLTEEVWTLRKKLAQTEMALAQQTANLCALQFERAKAEDAALGDKWQAEESKVKSVK